MQVKCVLWLKLNSKLICFTIIQKQEYDNMSRIADKFIVFSLVLIVPTKTISQRTDTTQQAALSLNFYEINAYVEATKSTPHVIIELDNNGQILLACAAGKTLEQLKMEGIQFTQSQIRLLRDWRLLQKEGEVLKTTFPILNGTRSTRLRNMMNETASIIGQNLQKDITELASELLSMGREKSIYTILFSYVLDDLVWRIFENDSLIQKRKITIDKPFWSGILWAIYPPRDFSCGTNSISSKGVTLKINWSKAANKKINRLFADWDIFGQMFNELVEKGKVETEQAQKAFMRFNLVDSSGNFTIPVITENKDNRLYQISLDISQEVNKFVLQLIDLKEIRKEFDFPDEEHALVISYHELMWELLDFFEQQGHIKKPIAFENPDLAQLKDIGDLLIIVKSKDVE